MACSGCSSAAPHPAAPEWAGSAAVGGLCSSAMLAQCDAMLGADAAVTLTTGGTVTGTLTWTFSAANFSKFKAAGIRLSAAAGAGNGGEGIDKQCYFSSINYMGTNWLLATENITFAAVGFFSETAIDVSGFGEITNASPALTITILSADASGTIVYVCTGLLYGWALRALPGAR